MTLRQRAVHAREKQERSQAILAAAERLVAAAPDRLASMGEVADEAGVAKGTVYLYFRSKEELYLALHERKLELFFDDVVAATERPDLALDDMLALVRRHMVDSPVFLPLAARCLGVMAERIADGSDAALGERLAPSLARAAAGLERRFAQLGPAGGTALLRASYALILGLWHMAAGTCAGASASMTPSEDRRYCAELDRGLRALWRGMLGAADEGGEAR